MTASSIMRALVFGLCLSAMIGHGPATQAQPVALSGDEKTLSDWSVRLVSVDYGDMSAATAFDSSVSVTVAMKNLTTEPLAPDGRMHGAFRGISHYDFHRNDTPYGAVVPPGGEVMLRASRRLSYVQHRFLHSIVLTEYKWEGVGRQEMMVPVKSVDLPLPPLSPRWISENAIPIQGAEMRMSNWSARLDSIFYGTTVNIGRDVVIGFRLKNLSTTALQPYRHFEWVLKGTENYSLADFNVMPHDLVPPGGEIVVYAHHSVEPENIAGLRSLSLTEHQPGPGSGRTARTALATVELALPPAPPLRTEMDPDRASVTWTIPGAWDRKR